jgi:hypothetical protein
MRVMQMAYALAVATALATIGGCAAEVDPAATEGPVGAKTEALYPRTSNCSTEDANQVRAAVDSAHDLILDSLNDLDGVANGGDFTRFDYWFGSHSADILDTVTNVFVAESSLIRTAEFSCDCPDDQPGVVASTITNDPNQLVHLCRPFFEWAFTEYSVGSIIHELSHLAGTIHWLGACSQEGSYNWPDDYHQLAVFSPYAAANDAENYRLYGLGWHPGGSSSRACGETD